MGHVVFRQFVDDDLGCASYLVGDSRAGDAFVIDPAYAIEQYLEAADEEGVRIVRVLETHTHADHVSVHGRLALEHGVPVSAHPLGRPEYPYDPLEDGKELEVGGTTVRVVHTPGHRPEHCAFVVDERIALTGDSLFIGDAARPDLAVDAHEGAEDLFRSLERLKELPDGVEVYPGHVAGSLCGAAMRPDHSSTIGEEKRTNAALRLTDLQLFIDTSASISTPRPPTTARVVAINRGPFLGKPDALRPLDDVAGCTMLDVRSAEEHARGHAHGAISVPVGGSSFATRAGFVLDPDERIALRASSPQQAERAAQGLRAIGFLELAGYTTDADSTEQTKPVSIEELEHLFEGGSITILDVREKDERDSGYIPGSVNIPYRLLRSCGTDSIADGKQIVTICESGARAGIAASVLTAAGIDARPVLEGGVGDWPGQTVEFHRCGNRG